MLKKIRLSHGIIFRDINEHNWCTDDDIRWNHWMHANYVAQHHETPLEQNWSMITCVCICEGVDLLIFNDTNRKITLHKNAIISMTWLKFVHGFIHSYSCSPKNKKNPQHDVVIWSEETGKHEEELYAVSRIRITFSRTREKWTMNSFYSSDMVFNGGGAERFNWFSRSFEITGSSRYLNPLHDRPVSGSLIRPSS
jgi:hypothetical protein